jgi:hypothetical protein
MMVRSIASFLALVAVTFAFVFWMGCATRVHFDPAPDVIVIWGNAEMCEAPGVCSHGGPISETFAGLLQGVASLAAEVFGDGPPAPPPVVNVNTADPCAPVSYQQPQP